MHGHDCIQPFQPSIGCAASTQVCVNGKFISRDSLVQNEKILSLAIQHVGSRVSVPVVYQHLDSFYNFISVPMDSGMAVLFQRICT